MARRRKRSYTVRTGDTPTIIAKQLGVDPQTLMRANTGVGNLRAGMVLSVPPAYTYSGFAKTDSVYPLDKMGGVMAFGGDEVPRPPETGYRAAYPPSVYEPAGYGVPTDYTQDYFGQQPAELPPHVRDIVTQQQWQTLSVAAQQQGEISDAEMISWGFVKTGGIWTRPPAVPGGTATAGALSWEDVAALKGRGSSIETVKGTMGDYEAKVRYDAFGNVRTFAPVLSGESRRNLARGSDRGISQRVARSKGGGRGIDVSDAWKYKKKKGNGGAAVGRAATYQQQYGGYGGGGSYMPSVKQFARPNYLGLVNWRI